MMSLIRGAVACVLLPSMASIAACSSSSTGGAEPGTDGGAALADSGPTGSGDSGILAADSGGVEVDSGSDAGSPPSGEGGVRDAAPDGGGSSFGTGTTYSPVYMCASGGTCTGNVVTGGGAMPSTSGSPNADSCTTAAAGANVFSCLNALTSVSTSVPLVIHSGTYSWSGNTLTVNRSLIGADTGGGWPILNRTDMDNQPAGSLLAVPAASQANWIYGLQLILPNPCYGLGLGCPSPGPGPGGVEDPTLIAIGSIDGLTIENNLIQGGGNGINDMWIDHTENCTPSTPGARNVLIDGNTFQRQHRTNMDFDDKTQLLAAVNNSLSYTDGYVSSIDLEPYSTFVGTDTITNHEYSYNKFEDPTPAYNGNGQACTGTGNCYVEGVISTGGTVSGSLMGSKIYASHNYGSWDSSVTFLYNTNFSNVVDAGNNVRGNSVPQ